MLGGTACQKNLGGGAGLMAAVVELGLAGDGLGFHLAVLIDLDLSIEPAYAIETNLAGSRRARGIGAGMQLTVGIDESEAVVLAQLRLHPQDAEISVVPTQRVGLKDALAGRLVIRQQTSDRPRSHFAGQAYAIEWVDDAPCENQIDGRLKIVGIFLKEGTLFREKHFESLVHRNLRIIGFNLPEA